VTAAHRVESLLAQTAARHPEAPALAHGDDVLTYAQLDAAVARLSGLIAGAAGGEALGGARVAIVAPNAPALVIALFATWRLGAVAVPLSARLREHELTQTLADAEPAVVLSVREHLGYAFTELLPRLLPGLPSTRACLFVRADGEPDGEVRGTGRARAVVLEHEIAAVLYTSGTTGTPKGALVTHQREVRSPRELAGVLRLTSGDGVVMAVPVSHAFGFTCVLATLAAGAKAVLVDSTTTVRPLLTAIERHAAGVLHGSPALFTALLKSRPEALRGIRGGFVAGASSPPGLQERLDEIGVLNLYGLTETGAVACCRPDDPPERRRTTAGRPLPGIELRAVDGELQIRGGGVMPRYLGRPEETAAVFDHGWFRTGDLVEIDDGYLRISGRLKELVHVGGFNVFPAEVEAVLALHPDVLQAAVVGVADERMGEALRAYVVARPGSGLTAAALLGFARGRIAGYKLPYAITFLSELPLLPSGKPDRRALAAR
jgi:HIP---CoA ligase